ncbi:MAG: hypothetical protein AAGA75_16525 [Cyanobacteria bacterium P01_E01_bin.6]
MGFIGKIFGAIFGFIGALLAFPAKILGFNKKSEFFMEADDSQNIAPTPAAAPAAKTTSAAPAAQPSASVAVDPDPVAATPSAPAPDPVAATASTPAAAVPAVASSSGQNGSKPFSKPFESVTFAPDRLLTIRTTGGRRRPGPSLSPFKMMAKQVKLPKGA